MNYHDDVPYEELDSNIRSLVRVLSTFAGTCLPSPACVRRTGRHRQVKTLGSCGGHPDPVPGQACLCACLCLPVRGTQTGRHGRQGARRQAPEGNWWVTFQVKHSEEGWFALEFLAWLINNDYRRAGHKVQLYPTSAPPYLSATGRPQQPRQDTEVCPRRLRR